MSSFLAFGKDYVNWNYEKTGNPVYLHIKQTKKVVSEDRPSKKPTILAIGMLVNMLIFMLLSSFSFLKYVLLFVCGHLGKHLLRGNGGWIDRFYIFLVKSKED